MFESAVLCLMSQPLADSLSRYLRHVHGITTHHISMPEPPAAADQSWVWRNFEMLASCIQNHLDPHGFRGVLSGSLAIIELHDPDLSSLDDLYPLHSAAHSAALASMLILAFPEIHWVLHTSNLLWKDLDSANAEADAESRLLVDAHIFRIGGRDDELLPFIKICEADFQPQYDPCGLRERIRRRLRSNLHSRFVPVRQEVSVSIDDEPEYGHFTAWSAYRHGFRVHVVRTLAMMRRLLDGRQGILRASVSFEDLYLSFPDSPSRLLLPAAQPSSTPQKPAHLSSLTDRGQLFPTLDRVPFRWIVTGGHGRADTSADPHPLWRIVTRRRMLQGDSFARFLHKRCFRWRALYPRSRFLRWISRSAGQLARQWDHFRRFCIFSGCRLRSRLSRPGSHPNPPLSPSEVIFKPVSGFLDFWDRAGLTHRRIGSHTSGFGANYRWPPPANLLSEPGPDANKSNAGHSAPGRLLAIAERLIARARSAASSSVHSVPETIIASLLALDAQEYLGCKVPTTSLHALALKHQIEAVAESQFYGVSYRVRLDRRFRELRREVEAIGDWFHPSHRRRSELDAQLAIVRDLANGYRRQNQFDEETACIVHSRVLLRKRWNRDHPWIWLPCFWPLLVIRWYIDEVLLRSIERFVFATGGLFLLLWTAIAICHDSGGVALWQATQSTWSIHPLWARMQETLLPTIINCLGINPYEGMGEAIYSGGNLSSKILHACAGGFGLFHLGAFISLLFARLSRR